MNPPQQIPPGRPEKSPAATRGEITTVPDKRLFHGFSPVECGIQQTCSSTVPGSLIISIRVIYNMYYDLI
jgi:hypothetical protein